MSPLRRSAGRALEFLKLTESLCACCFDGFAWACPDGLTIQIENLGEVVAPMIGEHVGHKDLVMERGLRHPTGFDFGTFRVRKDITESQLYLKATL